jgi:hypothetical protein
LLQNSLKLCGFVWIRIASKDETLGEFVVRRMEIKRFEE